MRIKSTPLFLALLSGSVPTDSAAEPAAAPAAALPSAAPRRPTGTIIVPALEKPAHVRKLEEKDMGGYLMVYFKDQTHSAYFAISRDGYTFTDVNGGDPVFDGAVIHLTLDELRAVAAHWNVEINLE